MSTNYWFELGDSRDVKEALTLKTLIGCFTMVQAAGGGDKGGCRSREGARASHRCTADQEDRRGQSTQAEASPGTNKTK